jgi:quinol monooxygenase YgiN
MSVIVIGHITVDPAAVERLFRERAADFEAVAADSRTHGAISHRWGFGDGQVLIVDEWPDADSFQKFFDNQQMIPTLMQAAGVTAPPSFEFFEAKDSPDTF